MADLLGPSGQPLPPSNPLLSQRGASSTASVNTDSAEKAFAHLQKVLDDLMKSFGGNWDKVTNDRLKAEERFYNYVGDKARARQLELNRYSKEAIANIDAETDALINKYKQEKHSQEEINKYTIDLNKKANDDKLRIGRETDDRLKQSRGFRGALHGAVDKVTAFAGGIGGPVGSTISGVGNLITNPYTAIPAAIIAGILGALEQKSAYTRVGIGLGGAGLSLSNPDALGEKFTDRLFRGMSTEAFSPEQQRHLVGVMSESRGMIAQTGTAVGIAGFQKNLGLYGNILPDVEKNTEFLTATVKAFGSTQEDLSNTFVSSRVNAAKLGLVQQDALKTQMDMQKALRNITNDGTVAASVLYNISDYLNTIGASEEEKQRLGLAIGQAGSNLTLPQIAGMFAFTHNGKIPGPEELFGSGGLLGNKGTGVFGLMGQFLTKVGGQFQDPTQRMYAANQLQQQYLPGLRLQDLPHFFQLTQDMMSGKINGEDFAKQFKELEGKTPQAAAADGINKLVTILGPETRISNEVKAFSKKLFDAINKLIEAINGERGGNRPSPLAQKQIDQKIKIQKENMA